MPWNIETGNNEKGLEKVSNNHLVSYHSQWLVLFLQTMEIENILKEEL